MANENADGVSDTSKSVTIAPKLVPFGNPITFGLLILVLALIGGGLFLSFTEGIIGVIIASIGGAIYAFGVTKHLPSKPRQAGLLTLWDSPLHIGGKTIVVGGTTILADYFPFKLGSIVVDMENKDKNFIMTIVSTNKIPMKGKVSVTCRPDSNDLEDFNQAGNDMDRVFEQLEDIVYQETQEIITKNDRFNALFISQNGNEIANLLHQTIPTNDRFKQKAFGIRLEKVRVDFPLPEGIQTEMINVEKEVYQRESEMMEYETLRLAAIELQRAMARQHIPNSVDIIDRDLDELLKPLVQNKTISDFNTCLEIIRNQRLVKDGKVTKIEGGGTNMNLVGANIKT